MTTRHPTEFRRRAVAAVNDFETSTRRRAWLAILAAAILPYLLLGAVQWRYGTPIAADDWGQYLSHARALLEGRAYTDVGYVYNARLPYIGPPTEPPGLPATLVPVLWLFGDGFAVQRLFMLACGAVLGILVGRYFAERDELALGAAAAFLSGVALQLHFATSALGADLGFAVACWATALLVDRPGRWSPSRVAGVLLVGLVAIFYRLAAAPLIPALVVWWALRRREVGWGPLVPVVPWTVAFVWTRALSATLSAGVTLARPVEVFGGSVTHAVESAPAGALLSVGRTVLAYARGLADAETRPFHGGSPALAFHVVATALVAIGLIWWLVRSWRSFLAIFAAGYAAMLVIAPVMQVRYLWPFFPLLAFAMATGLAVTLRPGVRSWEARAPLAAMAAVALAVVSAVVHRGDWLRPSYDAVSGSEATFARVAALPHASSRVGYFSPRVLTWRTRVPAMGIVVAEPPALVAELRANALTHVVVADSALLPGTNVAAANAALARAIAASPGTFTRVWSDSSFALYEIVTARAP